MAATARRRNVLRAVAVSALLLLAFDLGRPAPRQFSARLLLGGIGWYQRHLSARVGALGTRCRFQPTCSHYGAAAIASDGALLGTLRTAWRILRCGPWSKAGTLDPP